jgi:hypothetical protein
MHSQTSYPFHEASVALPKMSDDDFRTLVDDIKQNGLTNKISVWKGQIVDGRHRLLACEKAGVEPQYELLPDDTDPFKFAFSANIARRNLSQSQKAMIAAKLTNTQHGGNRRSSDQETNLSLETVAEQLEVSIGSIKSAKRVIKSGNQDVIDAVESNRMKVSAAEKIIAPKKLSQKTLFVDVEPVAAAEEPIAEPVASVSDSKQMGSYDLLEEVRARCSSDPEFRDALLKLTQELVGPGKTVEPVVSEGVEDRGVVDAERQVVSPVKAVARIYHSSTDADKQEIAKAVRTYWEVDKPKSTKQSNAFVKPTLEEVREYIVEGKRGIDPQAFIDHYDANGWVQGKGGKPVKDWKACVRTWQNMRKGEEKKVSDKQRGARYKRPEELTPEDGDI